MPSGTLKKKKIQKTSLGQPGDIMSLWPCLPHWSGFPLFILSCGGYKAAVGATSNDLKMGPDIPFPFCLENSCCSTTLIPIFQRVIHPSPYVAPDNR